MSIIKQLRRRSITKVAIAYSIAAWLLVDVSATTFPMLRLPEWAATFVIVLLIIGFPLVLIFAWAFYLTPEGIKLREDIVPDEPFSKVAGRKLDFFIIAALALVLGFVAIDQYVLEERAAQSSRVKLTGRAASVDMEAAEMRRSIAVLPFRNRSAVAEDAYFVDGIHDDILTQLSKLSSLEKVISRTSTERFRDTTKSISQIGQDLGVANIVEGGVQRAGNRVRINVQLIDAASDEHLWAETYDRKLTTSNIFAIQSEIAMAIADALRTTLTNEEQLQLSAVPTEHLAAYDAYLLGKQAMANRTVGDFDRATRYFEEAVLLDPDFALAYVGRANSISLLASYGGPNRDAFINVDAALSEAESSARRALALNARLGDAYAALGFINRLRGQNDLGKANLKKALDLSPNLAAAYHWYALVLSDTGEDSEALFMMQRGVALDPLSRVMQVNLSGIFDALGRRDDALASLHRSLEIDPQYDRALTDLGRFHFYHGRLAEAILWYRKALEIDPSNVGSIADIAAAYRHLGAVDEAEYWISRVMESNNSFEKSFAAIYQQHDLERYAEAAEDASAILSWNPGCVVCLMILGDHLSRSGQPAALIKLFQEHAPSLFAETGLEVKNWHINLVPATAWALQQIGKNDQAERLLNLGLQIAITNPRQRLSDAHGNIGSSIVDVKIYALLGRKRDALDALRQAVDDGWRFWHKFHLNDPALGALRSDPEFIALREKIESDFAAQLEFLKEKGRSGELPPLPTGNTHQTTYSL